MQELDKDKYMLIKESNSLILSSGTAIYEHPQGKLKCSI